VAVLVGDFGAIGAVGFSEMLETHGLNLEFVTVASDDVFERMAEGDVDVVFVDRSLGNAVETAAGFSAEHAEVRVIVCSLDDTTMLVFPGSGETPYEAPLSPSALAAALRERR
jgi:hypothetical protein